MPATTTFTADAENFRNKPNHYHVDLTANEPGYWFHYSFLGSEMLHVKTPEEDFRFESLMLVGDDIEYVAPSDNLDFASVEAEVTSSGRKWKIGTLRSNVRVAVCTLWNDHGFLMKL